MIMKNTQSGFTLIELMISVAIVGILAAIAYPSYQDKVIKSRRTDAQGALLGFANAMERYFTENNTYKGAAGTMAAPTDTGSPWIYSKTSPVDGGTAYYNLIIIAATATTYTLQATPINAQAGNGIMQITGTGLRGWDRNNDSDTSDTSEDIWD
jgi:type IV pilus assembly protein PilE